MQQQILNGIGFHLISFCLDIDSVFFYDFSIPYVEIKKNKLSKFIFTPLSYQLYL